MISLYAMHRFDLVFYARLIEAIRNLGFSGTFQLVVTNQVYCIANARDFIQRTFPSYLIAPTGTKDVGGVFGRIKTFLMLRAWIKSYMRNKCLLVLTDKSSPLSRSLLKRSSNAVLIQQIEEIEGDYRLDLNATIRDAIVSFVLGAYFSRWYVSSSSGGFVRCLKTTLRHKNIIKLFQIPDSLDRTHICLPPLSCSRKNNIIVIFGSRFLSWPYFRSGKFEQRLKLLLQLYTFIDHSFPLHKVLYLPHPAEKGDEFNFVNSIFRRRVETLNNYFSSEHFLYENRDIDYTFSMGSTSSLSAFNMGFSSKVFYKMFDFPGTIQSTYDRLFSGLPNSFFADHIGDLIVPCVRESKDFHSNGLVPLLDAFKQA